MSDTLQIFLNKNNGDVNLPLQYFDLILVNKILENIQVPRRECAKRFSRLSCIKLSGLKYLCQNILWIMQYLMETSSKNFDILPTSLEIMKVFDQQYYNFIIRKIH